MRSLRLVGLIRRMSTAAADLGPIQASITRCREGADRQHCPCGAWRRRHVSASEPGGHTLATHKQRRRCPAPCECWWCRDAAAAMCAPGRLPRPPCCWERCAWSSSQSNLRLSATLPALLWCAALPAGSCRMRCSRWRCGSATTATSMQVGQCQCVSVGSSVAPRTCVGRATVPSPAMLILNTLDAPMHAPVNACMHACMHMPGNYQGAWASAMQAIPATPRALLTPRRTLREPPARGRLA